MTVPTVIYVLRVGGGFRLEHVVPLCAGVAAYWPLHVPLRQVLVTDAPEALGLEGVVTFPLEHEWPGWWSKLEIFGPRFAEFGDLLYIDLDTVITGDLSDILAVHQLTLLQDFYRPKHLGSGLMYLPVETRMAVWSAWIARPAFLMQRYRGDQNFLEALWGVRAARWQTVLPGQVVSYKVHVKKAGVLPANARVVCFHGPPRPWQVKPGWRG